MVNLAKLRKKAKEKKEKTVQAEVPVEESVVREPEAAMPAPPVPAPADKIANYLATAGEARVAADASAAASSDAVEELELLTFVIAGEQYAIDIDEVVEIVPPRVVTRVPNADASVVGIFSLRGTVVMLVDARLRLGHPSAGTPGSDARIIVIRHDSENVGFIVDKVLRVTRTDATAVEPHPIAHSSEHDDSVRGVFRWGDALTIVLDLRKLLFTAWN